MKTIRNKIEEILTSNYDRGSNRKCIYCRYESKSDKNSLGMHMYKAHNMPTKLEKLIKLIEESYQKGYKEGFTDCQKMAKSGKYPELSKLKSKCNNCGKEYDGSGTCLWCQKGKLVSIDKIS